MKRPKPRRKAFTLLEMMLSVAVFVLLVTSAFSLVGATSELMTEVSEAQNEAGRGCGSSRPAGRPSKA